MRRLVAGIRGDEREARAIFDDIYIVGATNDDAEQFRAIGWSRGRICSVIFGVRRETVGDCQHPVTAWKATKQELKSYAEQV